MPGPGAWGPRRRGDSYQIYIRPVTGPPTTRSFTTEKAAIEFRDGMREEIQEDRQGGRTVSEAIEKYETHLREQGNRKSSLDETPRRLKLFFGVTDEADGGPLLDLDPRSCADRYDWLTKATYTRRGVEHRYSVDTHRNILAECKTFLAWCLSRHWIRTNPLAAVKGKGKRRHGKPQPTIDEARKWDRVALQLARRGETGAIAALLTVRLGLRSGEIVGRRVRDLDDEGRLLRVTEAKTDAGVRVVEVSEDMRPILVKLAKGRAADDLLFGQHWRDWVRKWVQRICAAAGVPKVSAHGMRGAHGTLAIQAGATSHLVAAALGHESTTTTEQSYTKREALEEAKRVRGMRVLQGGRGNPRGNQGRKGKR